MSGSLQNTVVPALCAGHATLQRGAGVRNRGGHIEVVRVHAVVVLGIGDRASEQLEHGFGGSLGGLHQVCSCGFHVFTTNQVAKNDDFARRDTQVLQISSSFHVSCVLLLCVGGLAAGVAAEGPRRSKLAELVADHIFGDIDGYMTAAVMNSDRVAYEGGEDRGASGPGLEDLLITGLVELFHALEQLGCYKRAFFNASAHLISSLLRVSVLKDILVGAVLGLAGLQAHCRLAPRRHRTGMANRRLAFAAAVRVVVRVHDGAADRRADAHVAGTAGLADVDVLMVDVADLADDCGAVHADEADFAGRETNLSQVAVLRHELSGRTGGADQLGAA